MTRKILTLKPRVAALNIGKAAPLVADRMRGRQLVERNRAFLAAHPVCEDCAEKPATEVDHKIPLHLGGVDGEPNLQGLCHDCHATKTAGEQARRAVGRMP